jgi:hypothetical protein
VCLPLASHRVAGWFAEWEKRAGAGSNRRVKGYGYQRNGFCHVLTFRPLRLTIMAIYATTVHIRGFKISPRNCYIILKIAIINKSMFRQNFPHPVTHERIHQAAMHVCTSKQWHRFLNRVKGP